MKEKISNQSEQAIFLPPVWCSSICRHAMSEVCVEHCALKRDCSGFKVKPDLKLEDMPRFPETKGMTRDEKFTSVAIYLSKVVDCLQGIEDQHESLIIFPPMKRVEKPKEIAGVAANLLETVTSMED